MKGEKNFPLTIILFAMFTLVCLSEDGVQPKYIARRFQSVVIQPEGDSRFRLTEKKNCK